MRKTRELDCREKDEEYTTISVICSVADNHAITVHDADFRTSWKDWESFVEALTEKIVEKDDTIPELPPKDLVQ